MSVDRKQQLFEDIVRLRRAEREVPGNRDLVAVRSRLERELGGSVSRTLAARLLGLSHTAINRWIKSGDIPTVVSRSGRHEVPVPALVDLYEAVERERTLGKRLRHRLEPAMVAGRHRAHRLQPRKLVTQDSELDGHRPAELRSLAYHRALAKRLRRADVDDALHLIWQWSDSGRIDPHYAGEWEQVLRLPLPEIKRIISEDSQRSRDLRQNSPFAGVLSEPERRRILAEFG